MITITGWVRILNYLLAFHCIHERGLLLVHRKLNTNGILTESSPCLCFHILWMHAYEYNHINGILQHPVALQIILRSTSWRLCATSINIHCLFFTYHYRFQPKWQSSGIYSIGMKEYAVLLLLRFVSHICKCFRMSYVISGYHAIAMHESGLCICWFILCSVCGCSECFCGSKHLLLATSHHGPYYSVY
jgi:hypothetical protein